jgi:2-dehydropantoate 2-reductase
MEVLVIGAGVIGSVYGAHLAAAGHSVSVLRHSTRSEDIARDGLVLVNVDTGKSLRPRVKVVGEITDCLPHLVLVAVRSDQLTAACSTIAAVRGRPTLLFFGNNPEGRQALPRDLPGTVGLGFPGVGGQLKGSTVEYVVIRQQPTALEADRDMVLDEIERSLREQGLRVNRVAKMDGWLLYHATFIASVSAALYRCGTDPIRLAGDRAVLSLMCRSVTEGFAALRREGIGGAPGNLAFLHRALLHSFAVRYWSRTMRSPMGELCFAAHARHAKSEMLSLVNAVIARFPDQSKTETLHRLLRGSGSATSSLGAG